MTPTPAAPLVFISGASSGIGLALAKAYASQGHRLALCARNLAPIEAWQASQPELAQTVHTYQADVTDAQAMQDVAQRCMAEQGLPNVVIANAGISIGIDLHHAEDLTVAQKVFDTNVMGVLHTLQPFLPAMRERGHGHLVAIASVAGLRGLAGQAAYCASKSAVITLMESLWAELRHTGIAVTTINPGWVHTPLTASNRYPMPFLLQPEAFATLAIQAIAKKPRLRTLPWPMGVVSWMLRRLPASWLANATANRPRKLRESAPQSDDQAH